MLAFSAPLGYCVFHNTTATLYYISDCIAALLDFFWFIPWLKGLLGYFLLLPYRLLCVLTGGGFYEESWRKVLEIILNEYSKKEMEALKVSSVGYSFELSLCSVFTYNQKVNNILFSIRYYHCQKKLLWRRSLAAIGNWLNCGIQIITPSNKQRHKICSFRSRRHMKYFSIDIRQK